jgi:thioredoxin 1
MITEFTPESLHEALHSGKPVLLDFMAPWCGPCRQMAPTIESLALTYAGKAIVGKIDIDKQGELTEMYEVGSIPTIILLKGEKKLWEHVGACRADIIKPEINKALL